MDDPNCLPSEIRAWIYRHIRKPISGFEHKRKPDGEFYDYEEQVRATRYQIELVALSYYSRGKSEHEIICRLEWFT